MGIITGLLGLFGCNSKTNADKKNSKPTFEEQFETFKQLGFTLNQGIDTSDINRWKNKHKEFEDQPYHLMYQTLGSTIEREPWTPLTNKCWDFDLEAIEDHGAYVDIMKNISRITNGELLFENIEDYVNIEEGKAWVSFTCKGDSYKWELKVDNDWADGGIFDKVQTLADKYKTKGRFTFFNTGGQDFVLGYYTSEELEKIRQATGLEIVWLKAKGQIH
ncbi:hypothetical protein [Flavobacterium flavipallidum]|uniref:Lipoprotein n=1 Tax=Flavobacterium flavipallidum TaxID=3139140 RepID=A0ABU9HN72_9FLAO